MMLLGAMAFSSCDMDLKPVGTLDEEPPSRALRTCASSAIRFTLICAL